MSSNPPKAIAELIRIDSQKDIYRLRHALKRLSRRGFITFRERANGDVEILPTKKGELEITRYQMEDMKIRTPKHWDGLWRIITFDIPEERRIARDVLRRQLNRMGMRQLQRSVFIHPFPCEKEIDFLREFFEIAKHVHVFHAKSLEKDLEEFLRSQFEI